MEPRRNVYKYVDGATLSELPRESKNRTLYSCSNDNLLPQVLHLDDIAAGVERRRVTVMTWWSTGRRD